MWFRQGSSLFVFQKQLQGVTGDFQARPFHVGHRSVRPWRPLHSGRVTPKQKSHDSIFQSITRTVNLSGGISITSRWLEFRCENFRSKLLTQAVTWLCNRITGKQNDWKRVFQILLHEIFYNIVKTVGGTFTDASTSSEKTEQQLAKLIGRTLLYDVLKIVIFINCGLFVEKHCRETLSLFAIFVDGRLLLHTTIMTGWCVCWQCKSSEKIDFDPVSDIDILYERHACTIWGLNFFCVQSICIKNTSGV